MDAHTADGCTFHSNRIPGVQGVRIAMNFIVHATIMLYCADVFWVLCLVITIIIAPNSHIYSQSIYSKSSVTQRLATF